MIGIPVGLLASNAFEWAMHKYVLHERGRKKGTLWSFHWHEHHKASRKNAFIDEDYQRSVFGWNAQGKEALALAIGGIMSLPLLPIAPFYTMTTWYAGINYYRKHKRAHLDPEWAREHLPWHYDHHMGPNQNANWCVTRPWFDHLMGTREPYVGTEREAKDIAKRAARAARAANTDTATSAEAKSA